MLEIVCEEELKVDGLINPAEEISRQPNIQVVAWPCYLLIARFIVRIGNKK
jgi:hypothetical protein